MCSSQPEKEYHADPGPFLSLPGHLGPSWEVQEATTKRQLGIDDDVLLERPSTEDGGSPHAISDIGLSPTEPYPQRCLRFEKEEEYLEDNVLASVEVDDKSDYVVVPGSPFSRKRVLDVISDTSDSDLGSVVVSSSRQNSVHENDLDEQQEAVPSHGGLVKTGVPRKQQPWKGPDASSGYEVHGRFKIYKGLNTVGFKFPRFPSHPPRPIPGSPEYKCRDGFSGDEDKPDYTSTLLAKTNRMVRNLQTVKRLDLGHTVPTSPFQARKRRRSLDGSEPSRVVEETQYDQEIQPLPSGPSAGFGRDGRNEPLERTRTPPAELYGAASHKSDYKILRACSGKRRNVFLERDF